MHFLFQGIKALFSYNPLSQKTKGEENTNQLQKIKEFSSMASVDLPTQSIYFRDLSTRTLTVIFHWDPFMALQLHTAFLLHSR